MSNAFHHGYGGHGGGGGAEQGQQGTDSTLLCYFHPRELLVGVCAHCLRERLLLLLSSNQQGGGRERVPADGANYLSARTYGRALRRVKTGSIVSVFAIGSSLLHRRDSSRHYTHGGVHGDGVDDKINPDADADEAASIASLDDSFISIKFEDNGKATWVDTENQKAPAGGEADAKSADKAPAASSATTAVVEHARRGSVGVTRWRKQVVGRLLQLARWKKRSTGGKQAPSSAAATCHVADQQRSKGRGSRSWIRGLTRRRAAHGERAWP
uniref:Uncharacterized protein n=1 Tax=Avena sativa TaxID=4498 RepID=A0ACD5XFR0_AVESA